MRDNKFKQQQIYQHHNMI